jgi:transposase
MSQTYFCGIDVSKDSFSVAIKNGSFIFKDRLFSMDRTGFSNFENLISPFKPYLTIAMESTGIYHKNLLNFLLLRGYNTKEIDPYKMWRFFRFANPKPTVTDKKSAKTIVQFLEFNKDKLQNHNSSLPNEKYSLRYFVREKERLSKEIAKTKTEIKRILTLVFPEIEKISSLFSKEILAILAKFPSADKIRNTSFAEFVKQIGQRPKRGRESRLSLEDIYQLANNSIAFSYPLYEELLKIKINRVLNLVEEKENISKLIDEVADKFFKREIEILSSIPGIGRESAIYFMAEVIDIKRFANKSKLIGFCGLDPVIKQSGNYKASFRISKRGNAHARRIAFIMAGTVKRNCPYFREYYLKKRAEGKSYTEAVIATSTKLLRTIYTLLMENRCFK